jgi:hypothetical protein
VVQPPAPLLSPNPQHSPYSPSQRSPHSAADQLRQSSRPRSAVLTYVTASIPNFCTTRALP